VAYELEAQNQLIADQRFAKTIAIENEIMSVEPEGLHSMQPIRRSP